MEGNEQKPSRAEVLKDAKNKPTTTRAKRRARTMALVKQVEDLIAGLGPHQHQAIQVLVGQLRAMKPFAHNGVIVDWVPDEIIRQKAAIAILEWLHGKPREFQMQVRGEFEDLESLMQRMQQTPAGRAALARDSLQKTVHFGQEISPVLSDAAREKGGHAS
jgi:hypothetical protein